MKLTTTLAALLLSTTAAMANNLTSLGVTSSGETAWRITSTAPGPQTVHMRKAGGGTVAFIVNPGTTSIVIPGSTGGTYIAGFEAGDRNSVTKASGLQLFNPGPVNGADGAQGPAGADGKDGLDYDPAALAALEDQMAADRGLAALQTRTAAAGQWTGSAGLSGTEDGADAVAFGLRYGFSDRIDGYAVVARTFEGSTSWGAGATFIIGGN